MTRTEVFSMRLDRQRATNFVWFISIYVVLHFLLRIAFSSVIGTDDVTQAIHAQTLAWGYEFRQPPLYTWLQWGSDRLIGVGVASHAFLKYLLLLTTYLFIYLIALLVLERRSTAIIATISLWLTYPFAISIHQGVTHSILLTALIGASVWVFMRLEQRPNILGYIALGLVMGLGMFSKYGFLIFAMAFLLAALSLPNYRRILVDRRFLLSLGIIMLIAIPPLNWLHEHQEATARTIGSLGRNDTEATGVSVFPSQLISLSSSILQFLAPLWVFLLIFFPRSFQKLSARDGTKIQPQKLLTRTLLVSLAFLVVLMIGGVLGRVQPRWMHAFLLFAPLVFFIRAEQAYPEGVAKRGYMTMLVGIPVLVVLLWAGQTYLGPNFRKATRFHAPYDVLARDLHKAVNAEPGLIISDDEYIAGNMRLQFPNAVTIASTLAFRIPAPDNGYCLLLWNAKRSDSIPESLKEFLVSPEAIPQENVKTWAGLYHHSKKDYLEVSYLYLPPGQCKVAAS